MQLRLYHKDFAPFYGNNKLIPVLNYVYENSKDLIRLMNVIPFYANMDAELGSIFDGKMLKHLGYYFLLCALSLYIGATEANLNVEEEQDIDSFNTVVEDVSELAEIEGQRESMLNEVCKLLNVYIKNFKKYKDILSRTKEHITKQVLKSKEKEI